MKKYNISKHNTFYCIGLSYKKANAEVRGKFSIDASIKKRYLNKQQVKELVRLLPLLHVIVLKFMALLSIHFNL